MKVKGEVRWEKEVGLDKKFLKVLGNLNDDIGQKYRKKSQKFSF